MSVEFGYTGANAALRGLQKETHTLSDLWCAIAGLDQDVPALRAECCCDSLCECLDTNKDRGAGFDAEFQLLSYPLV